MTTGSTNVVVAVIDTGIDYRHPDLAPNMWRQPGRDRAGRPGQRQGQERHRWDDGNGYVDDVYGIDVTKHTGNPMDDSGHGSGLAGIIGAVGNNQKGIAGINWNVQLMALAIRNGTVAEFIEAADT